MTKMTARKKVIGEFRGALDALRARLAEVEKEMDGANALLDAVPVIRGDAADAFIAEMERERTPEEITAHRVYADECRDAYEQSRRRRVPLDDDMQRITNLESRLSAAVETLQKIADEGRDCRHRRVSGPEMCAAYLRASARAFLDSMNSGPQHDAFHHTPRCNTGGCHD